MEKEREWRCKRCGALLAKRDATGLTIQRSGLQATVEGFSRVTIVCYIPKCRTLNIITRVSTEDNASRSPAAT